MASATGGVVQSTVNNLDPKVLGTCADFEEVQVSYSALSLSRNRCHCSPSVSLTVLPVLD